MIIHMGDKVNLLNYMCGKTHDPAIKTEDWSLDITEVNCDKCIKVIVDRRRYYALVNKMHLKQKS